MKISFVVIAAFAAVNLCPAAAQKKDAPENKEPAVKAAQGAETTSAKGTEMRRKAGKKGLKGNFGDLSEEERKKIEKRWAEQRAAREAKTAAMRKAREEAAAKKQGITVEELRRRREERRAEAAGVSLEEWNKLDEKARRAKLVGQIKKKIAERDEAVARKEGVSVEEIRARRMRRRAKTGPVRAAPAAPRQGAVQVVPASVESQNK